MSIVIVNYSMKKQNDDLSTKIGQYLCMKSYQLFEQVKIVFIFTY